jgi:protein-S-isoprenylcysteine O-methyltransferase Ste14
VLAQGNRLAPGRDLDSRLAMLGSATGVNVFWALLLIPVGAYFIVSARGEETVMLQLFPEQYAAYRARTGMLAPWPFRRR